MAIQDVSFGLDESSRSRTRLEGEKTVLEEEIQNIHQQLEALLPQFDQVLEEEVKARGEKEEMEAQFEYLNSKQGRHDRFKNVNDRNEWISDNLREIEHSITSTTSHIHQAHKNQDESQKSIQDLKSQIGDCKDRMTGRKALLEQMDSEFQGIQVKKDE